MAAQWGVTVGSLQFEIGGCLNYQKTDFFAKGLFTVSHVLIAYIMCYYCCLSSFTKYKFTITFCLVNIIPSSTFHPTVLRESLQFVFLTLLLGRLLETDVYLYIGILIDINIRQRFESALSTAEYYQPGITNRRS